MVCFWSSAATIPFLRVHFRKLCNNTKPCYVADKNDSFLGDVFGRSVLPFLGDVFGRSVATIPFLRVHTARLNQRGTFKAAKGPEGHARE